MYKKTNKKCTQKSKVKLEWKAVKGANFYRISRTNLKGKGRVDLAEVKKCTFTDTTIGENKDYIYYVTPVKKIKVEKQIEILTGTAIETTIETAVEQDQTVEILYETVKEIIFKEGPIAEIIFTNKKIVATDHQKYSYTEMKEDISILSKKYNGLISYEIVGKSADGRDIYDVIIGNSNAKKSLLVVPKK